MLSKPTTTAIALLCLLLSTSALPVEEATDELNIIESRRSGYIWHISKFQSSCGSGICQYQFEITAPASGDKPAFMATCLGQNVPRGDRTLRNCSLNRGNLEGVQGVQAFIELRPVRPNVETRMVIQMGYSPGAGRVKFWRGGQTGNFKTFTHDMTQAGDFDIVPFAYAGVA